MSETDDMQRLAEEFGDDEPIKNTNKKQDKNEKIIEELNEPKEESEKKESSSQVKLHKIKNQEDSQPIKIKNGFSFGMMFALGFWVITLILLGSLYLLLLYLNFF